MRTEKRSSPQISGDMVSLHIMVSPRNGDTRGGPGVIRYIEHLTKTFRKKPVDRAGQKPVGQPAQILKFAGRVKKILIGSIFDFHDKTQNSPKQSSIEKYYLAYC